MGHRPATRPKTLSRTATPPPAETPNKRFFLTNERRNTVSDTTGIDPDLTPTAPDSAASDNAEQESPDGDVTSPDEVDPDDGTDEDDAPVDNPAG